MTKLTVTGTGDSLFVARFQEEYSGQIGSVGYFIQSCDIRKDDMNGLPIAAHGKEAMEILDEMNTLSAPYGVTLSMENDMMRATAL